VLDLFLSHLPSLWTILTGLIGGGGTIGLMKAYRTYWKQRRKNDAQDHEQRSDRVSEQSKRIDALLERMKHVERQQEEERKARVEAEVENKRLRAMVDAMSGKIDQLVAMVQDLREEAGMEPLTDSEKADLKDTPDFTSNDESERNGSSS